MTKLPFNDVSKKYYINEDQVKEEQSPFGNDYMGLDKGDIRRLNNGDILVIDNGEYKTFICIKEE